MKTPREKYMNDPEFRMLVDAMERYIEAAKFSPSEMLEAAMMASINYEMRHVRGSLINQRAEEAFRVLDGIISNPHG